MAPTGVVVIAAAAGAAALAATAAVVVGMANDHTVSLLLMYC